jgi:Tol biopolymer transport system component
VSPDGRHIAFVADINSATNLWLRSFDAPDARQIPGTSGVRGSPFWSPDSRTIAFFLNGKLQRVDLTGGAPQAIADLPQPLGTSTTIGGSWNNDGTILFAAGPSQPIFQVSAAGGVPQPATRLVAGPPETHGKPSFLPDGRRFLSVRTVGPKPAFGETRPLFQSGITGSVRGDNYAVSNDGQRLLFKRAVTSGRQPINMVLNWDRWLK